MYVVPAPKPLETANPLSPYEVFCQNSRKTPDNPARGIFSAGVPARRENPSRELNKSRVFRLLSVNASYGKRRIAGSL
jgi:hypothetical protein